MEQPRTGRACVIKYALVCIYTGHFLMHSDPEGHLKAGDKFINIIAHPPDDNGNANDQGPDDILYSHGDPGKWARFLSRPTGSGSMDDPHTFEMRITESDFIAVTSKYDGTRTLASEAERMLDDESNLIIKDARGDAILDDNGNKMVFVRFLDRGTKPWEPWVFHLKETVHGQETALTEREKKRLESYLAGAYDGQDEEGGQGGEGGEDEKDEDGDGEDGS